jgi:hypothetical protein
MSGFHHGTIANATGNMLSAQPDATGFADAHTQAQNCALAQGLQVN